LGKRQLGDEALQKAVQPLILKPICDVELFELTIKALRQGDIE